MSHEEPVDGEERVSRQVRPATDADSPPEERVPLDRDAIRNVDDKRIEWVAVPEWGTGAGVYVRELRGFERDKFEQQISNQRKGKRVELKGLTAMLVILATCDENREPVFQPNDIDWLNKKSAGALNRIYRKAAELSGLSEEDVEELLGNSKGDQSDVSGSS